jgi:hypothetical protein
MSALVVLAVSRQAIVMITFFAAVALAQSAAQAPAPSETERLRWLETFASCSAVWEVAADLAMEAPEERRFFLERRSESILAAQKMDRSAPVVLRTTNEELKPELVRLAALDPRGFMAGPFAGCSQHAETASRIAGAPNVVGAPGLLIQ